MVRDETYTPPSPRGWVFTQSPIASVGGGSRSRPHCDVAESSHGPRGLSGRFSGTRSIAASSSAGGPGTEKSERSVASCAGRRVSTWWRTTRRPRSCLFRSGKPPRRNTGAAASPQAAPGIGPTCYPGSSSAVTAVSASKANGSREDRSRRTTSAGAQSQAAGPSAPRPRSRRPISRTPWSTASRSESLSDMRQVLGAGGTEERKAIVKAFLDGIRIEASAGRAMLRWYRLPQTVRVKLVAVGGIEPPTRGL